MRHGFSVLAKALGLFAVGAVCLAWGSEIAKFIFIGALGIGIPALLSGLQKRAATARNGWRYLRPSVLERVCLVGCLGLLCIFLYVHIFVGNSRPNAESQFVALRLLIFFFGLGAVATLMSSFEVETRWNDDRIEHRRALYPHKTIRFGDIVSYGPVATGFFFCAARDGTTINFSPYANGAEELIRLIRAGQAGVSGHMLDA